MILPNDWEIKKCLSLSLAILLATLGLIGLASLGFDVPGLRQIVGFIFLTFIPGILILRILKIHNVGIIESLLYSVGLSLAFIMFSGVVANFALPLIGISRPISVFPIMATLLIFTLILMSIAYQRDKGFSASTPTKLTEIISPSSLFLILVLLLAIFGALMVNFYQNNILLLVLIIVVAGVVGLAVFGRFIDHKVYPLAIAIIAIGLLYQTTLISPYLTGFDIHLEYYFEQLIVENGYWDAAVIDQYNSVLSIVILAPIYSLILDIDGAWIFKVIYPFIFSLVPLALFHIFHQQMSAKKAFLAVFFFMAVPTFSLEMIALAKQQIAELFFVLFILLMVDRKLGLSQRLTLAIIFGLSIAVSHYGLAGIFLYYLGLGWILIILIRSGWVRRVWGWLTKKWGGLPPSLVSPRAFPLKAITIVVAVYFIGIIAYYGSVSSGSYLGYLANVGQMQTSSIITGVTELWPGEPSEAGESGEPTVPGELGEPGEPTTPGKPSIFFDFTAREPLIQTALGLDFPTASPQGKGFRIFQYITQLFIVIGFIRLIFKMRKLRFTAEYIAFTVASALLLAACIFLPYFSAMMNVTRFYHIALLLLAPLCILGGEGIWLGISALYQKLKHKASLITMTEDNQSCLRFLTLAVLIPYFLFTSGFIFEVTGHEVIDKIDSPYSIALSSHRVDVGGVFNHQDGAGADWLWQRLDDEDTVYTDLYGYLLLGYETGNHGQISSFPWDISQVPQDSYIYFRTWNTQRQEITYVVRTIGCRKSVSFSEAGVDDLIKSKNRIYSNGGAQVLVRR